MTAVRGRLLLVDDDEAVLETTAALLSDDFEVVTAPDGMRALELLGRQRFDVICADYGMPGMTGVELLRRAQAVRPLACILVTGHREYVSEIAEDMRQGIAVVLKPYEPQMLIDTVQRSYLLRKAQGMSQQARKAV
jgi:DNA-binding NtrC family response regulator